MIASGGNTTLEQIACEVDHYYGATYADYFVTISGRTIFIVEGTCIANMIRT